MQDLGKLLVVIGLLIAVVGGWLWSGRGLGWLGPFAGRHLLPEWRFQVLFPGNDVRAGQRGADTSGLVFAQMKPARSRKVASRL
jgi:hypothetical protein